MNPLLAIPGLGEAIQAIVTQAVHDALAQAKPQLPPMELGDAIAALLAEKQVEGLTRHYIVSLRQYLTQFARGREHVHVATLDAAAIEKWFADRNEAPATRASNLGRLSALFDFALRRGVILTNPVARIRPPKLRPIPPRILSPDEASSLLNGARKQCPEILAYLVVGLFAGVRPMEILDVPWSAVDLDRGLIRVDRTKTNRRRVAQLAPNAVAWLRVCDRSTENVAPSWSTVRRRRRALMREWPQDILRHTAASYLVAKQQDLAKVSLSLGNSPKILLAHYHELVSPDDCVRFWQIVP